VRVKRTKAIVAVLLSAVVSHLVFIYAYPYLVAISSYLATRGEVRVNEVYHQAPIDASFRKVVRPCPGILYSACVYDISECGLLIEARVPNFTYWSAAFYSISTDNYFTVNDRALNRSVSFTLTTKERYSKYYAASQGEAEVIYVVSPSTRGIAIFRIFIPHDSLLSELMKYQKSIKCTPIKR